VAVQLDFELAARSFNQLGLDLVGTELRF